MITKNYEFESKMWISGGGTQSVWHLVSLPRNYYLEIKEMYGCSRRGFGSIPVTVTIGNSIWQTLIFPSKELKTYILPIKASVRKAENLNLGELISYKLEIK